MTDASSELDELRAKAQQAIEDCRCAAIWDNHPKRVFFCSLALDLEPHVVVDDPQVSTACTDGARILINARWFLSCSPKERYGVLIGHETLHCAFDHMTRMLPLEDRVTAQVAADLEINEACMDAGYRLPEGACIPGMNDFFFVPPNRTFEEYYKLLQESPEWKKLRERFLQFGVAPEQDPLHCGGVIPCRDSEEEKLRRQGRLARAAQVARQRGTLPGSLERMIQSVLYPKADPWEYLQDFITAKAKIERSWVRPSRRGISRGLYLPSESGEHLGHVVLMVDVSGSMTQEQLKKIGGVMAEILARTPGKLTVLYHDIDVMKVQEWNPGDPPLKLSAIGGGGTSHKHVFARALSLPDVPVAIIAATDLYTCFPSDPGIPTIWLKTEHNHLQPPWGRCVSIADARS